ncbi:hypothetical protein Tco_1325646 [Tanacetum coccineum]
MESCDPVGTPMEIKDKLDLYQNGSPVDATKYRSMIGALMYLTSSRLDICTCYLFMCSIPGSANREAPQGDAHYAGCRDSFKSTSGGTQFLGEKLVGWSSKKQDCTALLMSWMAFKRNTRDLGSSLEETDKTTTLHQLF